MICPIHKTHFGKGFAGRGRRRCYECERTKPMEETIESLKADNEALGNDLVLTKAILCAMDEALRGIEPSDFMLSFPEVSQAWMVYRLAYPPK